MNIPFPLGAYVLAGHEAENEADKSVKAAVRGL